MQTMKRLIACLSMLTAASLGAASPSDTTPIKGQIPLPAIRAFPTAEGFGANSLGGRGGRVIEVTNLNDSGDGSLRSAMEASGPRICVFRVSGTITLKSAIRVSSPYLTVAGQTSPGGVQIRGHGQPEGDWGVWFVNGAHDVVIRHLRVRMGGNLKHDAGNNLLCYGTAEPGVHDVIFDHCSVCWGSDTQLDWYGSHLDRATFQWNIIAEADMGSHIGGNRAPKNITLHHNLYANLGSRTPLMQHADVFDFRNNVIYNWNGNNSAVFGQFALNSSAFGNIVDNLWLAGPESGYPYLNVGNGGPVRIDGSTAEDGGTRLYISGNWGSRSPAGCTNDWIGHGVNTWDYYELNHDGNTHLVEQGQYDARKPFTAPPVTLDPVSNLLDKVLATVGASRPSRDAIDQRIIKSVRDLTGTYRVSTTGPWPDLATGEPAPPTDSDHDGIPDVWEKSHGLDPNNNGDGAALAANGYSNVENYLNELAGDPMPGLVESGESGVRPDVVVFYVSPQGRDTWSGRAASPHKTDGPFATIGRAQQAVQKIRKTHPQAAVRVTLRGGTYYLDSPLEFGPEDSGTERAPVVYGAAEGEQVILSGGCPLNPAAFQPVRDPAILNRLPEEARGKLLHVDMRAQGITDFGVMRPRGQGRPPTNPAIELFFNGQPLQLARWPNRGMVPRGKVLDKGGAPRNDDFSNRGGTFTYDYDRPARWTQANDIWLSGYFATGYANDTIDVKSINLAERTITLARPHRYGLETIGPTQAYYALNLLEEIDEPGEWYLDRCSGFLYLWPPSDLSTAKISVSLLDDPMVAIEGASYVTLRGMTFENSRGMGIYMERGNGNLIAGCTFRNLGSFAVFIGQGIKEDPDGLTGYRLQNGADRGEIVKFEPASRTPGSYGMALYADSTWDRQAGTNHGVVGCDIYNIGAGGIVLGGGDRKTLTPAGNYVLNCHIHHFARLDGRFGAIAIDGVGNRVAHCLIHDGPLVAISFIGNDHVLEFNEIHDVCMPPVHDMGAVYTGRDPSAQGNLICNNFFHHIGNPETSTCAVYLDDGACGATVSGNVFYKVQNDALFGWGHNHLVCNNVFIDTRALIPSPMNNSRWTGYMADLLQVLRLRKTINVLQPPYVTRYPELAHLFEEDPNYPRRNIVHDNMSVRSGEFGTGSNDVKGNWVTEEDPGFVDEAGMNFQLKPDSVIWTKMPGFQRIPFERIGLYTDEYRKALPAREHRGEWRKEQ